MTALGGPRPPWLRDLNRFFGSEAQIASFFPPADVLVTDDGVTVHMDVPGVPVDRLDAELENDTLTVRGERPSPYGTDAQRAGQRLERGFGRFERSVRVPRGLDPNAIEATMRDGVLTLRLPKPESLRPHRIQVKPANESRELEGARSS
jgi:HSP20 family protein